MEAQELMARVTVECQEGRETEGEGRPAGGDSGKQKQTESEGPQKQAAEA